MPDAVHTIQLLVAPVVMISAAGLVCLALYNRLATIVGRIRAIHKEEIDTLSRMSIAPAPAPSRSTRRRVITLEEQVEHLMARARLVRAALVCLLATILSMLLCSLAIGLSLVWDDAAYVALAVFLLGVLVEATGVVLAILELRIALVAAELEDASIEPERAI
ncbi:MAG: DUF2721 domain-containing protein [Sandaracinus sp.]